MWYGSCFSNKHQLAFKRKHLSRGSVRAFKKKSRKTVKKVRFTVDLNDSSRMLVYGGPNVMRMKTFFEVYEKM
jgi:hypothetical protein